MEYPSINDFYIKLKAMYNKDGNFIDYMLIFISDNFYKATGINPNLILGKSFSDILVENGNILCLKDIYFNLIPNSKGKYEIFIKELERWYVINVFSDKSANEEDISIMFFNDITNIRAGIKNKLLPKGKNKNKINNIVDFQEISRISFRDKLTGLYNKDFFDEELYRLDTKRQLPISLIVGDINGLKLINDAFGHSMGDMVIKKAVEIIKNYLRHEDIISRVSGDKFMILLPNTPEKAALTIVDRIKRCCENNPYDFIKISIAFGAAAKETEDEDINDILMKAEERMRFIKHSESKEAKHSMINFLKNRLEIITFETKVHYENLKKLSLMLANEAGLNDFEKEQLVLLCEFHDIGKIGVSKAILQKEGSLNKEEWTSLKRHSEIGYNIFKEFNDMKEIDELILNHHERWDGNGYPGILNGEKIPVAARIFAIVDAYEAMVNDRPYKKRMTNIEALHEILKEAGKQFDPVLANIFIRMMDIEEQIV